MAETVNIYQYSWGTRALTRCLTNYYTKTQTNDLISNAVLWLNWKESVRVATTTAWTLATSFENGDTVDGVVLATGDRILIKNQVDQTANGIYVVQASGAPVRASDANSNAELLQATVFVREGTVNGDTQWTMTANSVTIGSSNITFAQVSWTGTYTAGTGLQLVGGQFSIDSTVNTAWSAIDDNVLVRWDWGARWIQGSTTYLDDTGKLRLGNNVAPTHSLTIPSTGNGIALYNTADETNYERLLQNRETNIFTFRVQQAWSGTGRSMRFVTLSSSWGSALTLTLQRQSTSFFALSGGTMAGSGEFANFWWWNSWTAGIGTSTAVSITPTINHTSTAWYNMLLINPTESTTGSGTKFLQLWQVGWSARMCVTNTLSTLVWYGTEAPTHTVTHSSGSSGMAMYNTSDQVTNFERIRQILSSNVFYIVSGSGGSGTSRWIQISVNANGSDNVSSSTTNTAWGNSSITNTIRGSATTLGNSVGLYNIAAGTYTNSSWFWYITSITATINQSGTAWYGALFINMTESSTWSWAKNLILAQVGSATKFGVDNFGHVTFDATNTAWGTTWNQTINKPSGTVNIAAAGTSVTVTNSLCTTSSIVYAVVRTNDSTATIKNVVPWAGSFTINLAAAATAETSIGFVVFN